MEVDKIFASYNTHTPGCSVGVSQGGKLQLSAGYGMADLERGVPIGPGTLFESGSIAKQFTAAALMLLEQEGKLSLDDRLGKYLTELTGAPGGVTIRQVISHISGLREWRPLATFGGRREEDYVFSNQDLLEMAARQKALNFDPGTAYSYSNTGYNISTILMERAMGDGRTFQGFTQAKIFEPLGMSDTRWRDNFRTIVPGRALAYTRLAEGGFEQDTPIGNIIGAGGLLTTVGDLLKWNENLAHARVGGPEFVKAQQKPAVLVGGKTITYAAGLMVSKVDGMEEVAHSGATGGYRTWMGRYPEHGVAVAVMCNSAQALPTVLGRQTARLWTGGGMKKPEVSRFALEPGQIGAVAGMYRNLRSNLAVMMTVKDGKLLLNGSNELVPVGAGRFAMGVADVRLESGSPMRLRLETPDGVELLEKVVAVQPGAAELAELTGEYLSNETASKVVVGVGGKPGELAMRVGSIKPMALRPTFKDAFRSSEGAVLFRRDAAGKVTGLSIGDARVWDLRFERVK